MIPTVHEIVTISGPSAAGKSTLVSEVMKMFPTECQYSVSHTTREPREGEVEGVDYYFVSKEEFHKQDFYESVQYADNLYGTSKNEIARIIRLGKVPMLDVHIDSLSQLRPHIDLKMTKVFVMAPSLQTLENRLKERSMKTSEIDKRMRQAESEIEKADKEAFQLKIINDKLENSIKSLKNVIQAAIGRLRNSTGNKEVFQTSPKKPSETLKNNHNVVSGRVEASANDVEINGATQASDSKHQNNLYNGVSGTAETANDVEINGSEDGATQALDSKHQNNLYNGVSGTAETANDVEINGSEDGATQAPVSKHQNNLYNGVSGTAETANDVEINGSEDGATQAPDSKHQNNLYNGVSGTAEASANAVPEVDISESKDLINSSEVNVKYVCDKLSNLSTS